jgi:hypothetical protein
MSIRLILMILAAVIAPACLCAAQDGGQNSQKENSQKDSSQNDSSQKNHSLLEDLLRFVPWDPGSYVIVLPKRVIVRSGASIVQDGRSEPALELICEGRWATVHDRATTTRELYPVPDGFCDLLRIELPGKIGGRP